MKLNKKITTGECSEVPTRKGLAKLFNISEESVPSSSPSLRKEKPEPLAKINTHQSTEKSLSKESKLTRPSRYNKSS